MGITLGTLPSYLVSLAAGQRQAEISDARARKAAWAIYVELCRMRHRTLRADRLVAGIHGFSRPQTHKSVRHVQQDALVDVLARDDDAFGIAGEAYYAAVT